MGELATKAQADVVGLDLVRASYADRPEGEARRLADALSREELVNVAMSLASQASTWLVIVGGSVDRAIVLAEGLAESARAELATRTALDV